MIPHDDTPMIEPGQLMPRLIFKDLAEHLQDPHPDPRKVAKAGRTFKMAIGPGLNQFRDNLLERWPEIPIHRGHTRRRQRPKDGR